MNNRHEGYSNVNRYAQSNRYNQQGNYSQQNRRQQVQNGRPMNNAPQRSGSVPSGRRTFSKPQNRSFANKVFRDRNGKLNVLGRIAVGTLTISTLAGVGVAGKYTYDTLKFNSFVHSEDYQKIVEVMQDNYENSEYLQVSIPREAYDEYTNEILKTAIKNEPNMQSFLSAESFEPAVWAYLLTGEANRGKMANEEILEALSDYLPYAEYETGDAQKDSLDNSISAFSLMTKYCVTEKSKNNVVNLLDTVIGQNSISNSKEALQYDIVLNEEEIERIQYNTHDELQSKCNINNNFSELAQGKNATDYLKPYVQDFYNSRVEFIQDKLNDKDTSPILKEALEIYSEYKKMDGVSNKLRCEPKKMMGALEIANYEEYVDYTSLRNNFYTRIMEEKNDSENATARIEANNSQLKKRIDMQEIIENFDISQYMSEIKELLVESRNSNEKHAEAENTQNHVNEKLHDFGFDGFDR